MDLHDADEIVGRITTRGAWDRRYRPRHSLLDELPEPILRDTEPPEHPARIIATILAQVAVLLLLFIGIGMWAWIGAAAQPLRFFDRFALPFLIALAVFLLGIIVGQAFPQ